MIEISFLSQLYRLQATTNSKFIECLPCRKGVFQWSVQVVHTQRTLPVSSGSIDAIRGAAMFCSWEGNRRSDVAVAMSQRIGGLSTYGFKA